MTVEIVTRTTTHGARYYYVVENGKRVAQCMKRKYAVHIQKALQAFAGEQPDAEIAALLERDRAARAESDQQIADQKPRASGLVVARRQP